MEIPASSKAAIALAVLAGLGPSVSFDVRDSAPRGKPAPFTPRNTVRRNEPCPCGSGKKWKRCCRNAASQPTPE